MLPQVGRSLSVGHLSKTAAPGMRVARVQQVTSPNRAYPIRFLSTDPLAYLGLRSMSST